MIKVSKYEEKRKNRDFILKVKADFIKQLNSDTFRLEILPNVGISFCEDNCFDSVNMEVYKKISFRIFETFCSEKQIKTD